MKIFTLAVALSAVEAHYNNAYGHTGYGTYPYYAFGARPATSLVGHNGGTIYSPIDVVSNSSHYH